MLTHDFEDGNGPVPAHRHINPNRGEGGWVADTAYVHPNAHVGLYSKVFGSASIDPLVWLTGHARVYDHAYIATAARVSGDAHILGFASIPSGTRIDHKAHIKHTDDLIVLDFPNGRVIAFPDINRVWYIRHGCQFHTLDYWDANLEELAKAYNQQHVDIARQTIALFKTITKQHVPIPNNPS